MPILLNLDHAPSLFLAKCHQFRFRFNPLRRLETALQKNLEIARMVTGIARKGSLSRGNDNINALGASSSDHRHINIETVKMRSSIRIQACRVIRKETKVDIFASFIGNVHGLYRRQDLRLDLLKKLWRTCRNIFIFARRIGNSR